MQGVLTLAYLYQLTLEGFLGGGEKIDFKHWVNQHWGPYWNMSWGIQARVLKSALLCDRLINEIEFDDSFTEISYSSSWKLN